MLRSENNTSFKLTLVSGTNRTDAVSPPGRATLTPLPQEVLEMIGNYLLGNDKVCCLPVPP